MSVAKPAYHHGNLRETLVLRGVEILETQGFDALSLRQVAREVGVSQTAPLHHFEGKQGYLAAIAEHGFRLLIDRRIAALGELTDARERLVAVMKAHLDFSIEHPALFRIMFGPDIPQKSQYPELARTASRSFALIEACVGDYLNQRQIPSSRLRRASVAAWTACHGLARVMAERETAWDIVGRAPEQMVGDIFTIFIAGLEHIP